MDKMAIQGIQAPRQARHHSKAEFAQQMRLKVSKLDLSSLGEVLGQCLYRLVHADTKQMARCHARHAAYIRLQERQANLSRLDRRSKVAYIKEKGVTLRVLRPLLKEATEHLLFKRN